MKAPAESAEIFEDGVLTLHMEPDIVTLGEYLAQKRGSTLSEFVEFLITKEAAKGK